MSNITKLKLAFTANIVLAFVVGSTIGYKWDKEAIGAKKASSFVGYSQSCWQAGDTLHVVTAKGDTVMFGISKLEGEK